MSAHRPTPRVPAGEGWQLLQSDGAGPFISRVVRRLPDGSLHTWISRRHRKGGGLRRRVAAGTPETERRISAWPDLWAPAEPGWWISVLFMVGSACFAAAGFAGLAPGAVSKALQDATVINRVFFVGSLFFTAAAYLQLLEASNADRRAALADGEMPTQPFRWFAWQPRRIGWLSAFVQFVGTLLFNLNTLDALLPGLDWLQQDLLVWTPDIIGCVCFLVASWLAVLEYCHGYWCGKLRSLSWWIVMVNLIGSIAFMVSGIFALVLPDATEVLDLRAANLWTFTGAVAFLIGAYLLLPEMATHRRLQPALTVPPASRPQGDD
jgi:hypothetical protein